MFPHKIPHPANFSFAGHLDGDALTIGGERFRVSITTLVDNVVHLRIDEAIPRRWERGPQEANIELQTAELRGSQLTLDSGAGLEWRSHDGQTILLGTSGRTFGVSGSQWVLDWVPNAEFTFYGMGEKWGSLDRTGSNVQFWNSDVMADFPPCQWRSAELDPTYASIPYLLVRHGDRFFGLLVDNPYAVFMCAGGGFEIQEPKTPRFFLGSTNGAPSLFFLEGPTLRELTQKLQRLVGVTPRPPLWALGHHQCRWGYENAQQLRDLAEHFQEHQIPNDGLWLDIGYMDAFKVFTFSEENFESPERDIGALRERGAHVVPIVDPGVKVEPGYPVYDEGLAGNHFCSTPEGKPFTGFVWPGKTHFPDFSRPATRDWWAARVQSFARCGISGVWIDMNDPSVGAVTIDDMLFGDGGYSHAAYHNQYALGMAKATRQGLLHAAPNTRPFVLSRSASTGMARYAAVWTGDNGSSETFLQRAIAVSLNLALSGIPFNGCDVPGFAGDADDDLTVRWYKACFLFPFLRNHSCLGTRAQEPWAFSERTLRQVRSLIRLRYKLLPYLYQLFIEQERTGEAILRPVAHDFEGEPLREHDFLVGPHLLQAPLLSRREPWRQLALPATRWFGIHDGQWHDGPASLALQDTPGNTPLFIRDGSVLPMQLGERFDNRNALADIELHVVLSEGSATLCYEFDDGTSFDYASGRVTRLEATATLKDSVLRMDVTSYDASYLPLSVVIVLHTMRDVDAVEIEFEGCVRRVPLRPAQVRLMTPLRAQATARISLPELTAAPIPSGGPCAAQNHKPHR